MIITERFEVSGKVLASGGFGVIRSGVYGGRRVAVKTARIVAPNKLRKIRKASIDGVFTPTWRMVSTMFPQQFYREVVLWGSLSHLNVLKLVGVQESAGKREFITVSEWMEHGTVMEYIKKHHADRLELVRHSTFPPLPVLKYDNSCMGRPGV